MSHVLILGATGHLGQHLPLALQERGHTVHALVRPESLASGDAVKQAQVDALRRRGVVLHPGSLQDDASLRAACAGIDVVISAVTGEQLGEQPKLFAAMLEAGVQRFLPSEFGIDTQQPEAGRCALVDWKRGVQAAVKASGVPYTMVYANGFASYWAASLGQIGLFAPPATSVRVFGDGDTPGHFVQPEDIARYVARIIDDPRTENREVGLFPADNRRTQNELIAQWESVRGATLGRENIDAATVDWLIGDAAGKPERMMEWIVLQLVRSVWIDGALAERRDGVLDATRLYPDVGYTRVDDFVAGFAAPSATASLSDPVQAYLKALNAGDTTALSSCFAQDYRSDQPGYPGRAFCGREVVVRNHVQLFERGTVRAQVQSATTTKPDASGVRRNYLELTYDLNRHDGTTDLLVGTIVFGATDKEIRWGRLHLQPVDRAELDLEIDALIDQSRGIQ